MCVCVCVCVCVCLCVCLCVCVRGGGVHLVLRSALAGAGGSLSDPGGSETQAGSWSTLQTRMTQFQTGWVILVGLKLGHSGHGRRWSFGSWSTMARQHQTVRNAHRILHIYCTFIAPLLHLSVSFYHTFFISVCACGAMYPPLPPAPPSLPTRRRAAGEWGWGWAGWRP